MGKIIVFLEFLLKIIYLYSIKWLKEQGEEILGKDFLVIKSYIKRKEEFLGEVLRGVREQEIL